MDNFSPEVLIYIQTVKNYFKTNKEANEYFLQDSNEELFYKHLGEISQKNFEKDGEVMLNKEQFELLRKTVAAITISKKPIKTKKSKKSKLFFEIPNFGQICLN